MTDDLKLDVLAIAAHRDDVEITSGGLMAKLASKGYKTGILDFTRGEMGSRGTDEDREREAQCAGKVLGVSVRENLGLPDGNVQHSRENLLKVVAVLRKYRPHMVILPHEDQRHPDHFWCFKIGKEACYFSGLKKLEADGEPHRPHKMLYSPYYRNVKPSMYVDISEHFERKIESVRCYESQFGGTGTSNQVFVQGIDVFDYLRTQDHANGQKIRVDYAELYIVRDPIEIDDPMTMSVASV